MKIGLLSLYYKNYNMGGLLQAYALQKVIQKFGCQVEQVSFDYLRYYDNNQNSQVNSPMKTVISSLRYVKRNWRFLHRLRSFSRFMNIIPHSEKIYSSIEEFAENYDRFIVGSDQVWGEWLPIEALKSYLLCSPIFDNKRHSYAASIGTDTISSEFSELYQKAFYSFNTISVREESAKAEIKNLIQESDVSVHLDPTLLLTADEWSTVAEQTGHPDKYIFCYFLGKNSDYRKGVEKFAQKVSLPIVTLPFIKDNKIGDYDINFGTIRDFKSGPTQFLHLIKNAEFIITDSFHAVVFSCLFHKKFYVLDRVDAGVRSTNNRISDFLRTFELTSRYIAVDQLEFIDFNNAISYDSFEEKLSKLREESYSYLKSISSL